MATPIFINEIHYDNSGTDAGEFIEIAGPAGSDLTGWSLVLYNGSNSQTYDTQSLTGSIADEQNGYGTVVVNFPVNGLQNGAPDGVALVDNNGNVVQFLSYEGTITAANGPAAGMTSTDIGVAEDGSTAEGASLQLTGTGTMYEDFSWSGPATASNDSVNDGQTFGSGNSGSGNGPAVFINEIHYDNDGTDSGEAIEVAGPAGTDLSGWTLVLYNGNGGAPYDTIGLSGSLPDQDDGYGTTFIGLPVNGLQNGSPDGIALVDNNGNVLQFLSYEGSFTAVGGAADGMTSEDIGVAEGSSTPIGASLQLTGTGTNYGDFTWAVDNDDNFGAVNNNQDFAGGGGNPAGTVSIADASIVEGDSGTTGLTFTLTRNGDSTGEVTVDYATANGIADDSDYVAANGTVTFADGVTEQQITIQINGDTDTEANETFSLNLSNPTGGAAIGDGSATGTIINDDVSLVPIYTIQGAGHQSSFDGQSVTTSGIVTATAGNGFYMQDPTGDGDFATSDGIFVFTGASPSVAIGDEVQVSGIVDEFIPGGASTGNLSTTEIVSPTVAVLSSGNALPSATLIGPNGITPPTENVDDDLLATFDPLNDGIDFFEALEGMLVNVESPIVAGPTTGFGEVFTVASDNGANPVATNMNDEGFLVIEGGDGELGIQNVLGTDDDYNPELIQFDDTLMSEFMPAFNVGDRLNDVTGVVSYNFGVFEVLPTVTPQLAEAGNPVAETTSLAGDDETMTVATYNVLNLDPGDGQARFDALAFDIATNLNLPDVIGLQEIQDNSGPANDGTVAANLTLQQLADAIFAQSGVTYSIIDNSFIGNDTNGGEPVGNIRTAFLYRDDRVDLVDGSVKSIADVGQQTDPGNPFFNSRLPLVADFAFAGQTVTVVNNHFSSKGGSTPLLGAVQPPLNGSSDERADQAAAVNQFVDDSLALNSNANIVVLGDLNEFYFEEPLLILTGELDYDGTTTSPSTDGQVLTNLTFDLDEDDRYSYIFNGNAQQLDHILITNALLGKTMIDAVHINSPFADAPSDHDPLVASISFAPAFDHVINGDAGDDNLVGTPLDDQINGGDGNDTIQGRGGNDQLNGGMGNDLIVGSDGNDEVFGGEGDDQIDGSTGDDELHGQAGNDKIFGGVGDDIIWGNAGKDDMTGGAGDDRFVFLEVSDSGVGTANADLIRDFAGGDLIDLSAIDANANLAGNDAFAIVASFGGNAGELIARQAFGNTYAVEGDVDGDGNADFTIVTINSGPLDVTDFVL